METRANYALVGFFTLTVIAAALGFIYWFAAGQGNGARVSYRVVFQGSVSGLVRGSPVRFNGLRVGEVTTIDFLPNDPSRMAAQIDVDARTPVKTDTRARLEYQGLTGQAAVALSGGASNAPNLTTPDGSRPTIFADRSDFQDLLETGQRLATRIEGVLLRVDKLVADNETSITSTFRSIEVFARALSENSAGVSAFLQTVGETAQRISALSVRLESLSTTADELLRTVDGQRLNRTIANVEDFTRALADNRQNIDTTLSEAAQLARRLNEIAPRIDQALIQINGLASAIDGAQLGRTVENVDRFARALGDNAPQVDRTFKSVAEIAEQLKGTADRLDRVLAAGERFLGTNEGDGRSAFGELAETAKAFRTLAQNIDSRIVDFSEMAKSIQTLARNLDRRAGEITAGINRLSSSGSRDIEALAADARRAVNEVNRAVRSIGRDPSQVITGGRPSIPEYSGSR
jgi:phospholipid/cholesterol/gamma-HCH transport system substrate-binding protein